MAGSLHDLPRIRTDLEETVSKARREALVFSIGTVLMTPGLLILAVLAILWGMKFVDSRRFQRFDSIDNPVSLVSGTNLFLMFMFIAFWWKPKTARNPMRDLLWVGAALAVLGLILALSYAAPAIMARPGLFWPLYGGLVIAMFGLLGYAYEPRDDYYLGWGPWGAADNPFTIRDDMDRGHVALGCAAAIPNLVFSSYGAIFGSTWLWRGLDAHELDVAAEILQAIGAGRPEHAEEHLRFAGPKTAARVLRALAKLELVGPGPKRPILTSAGEKFVGVSEWF